MKTKSPSSLLQNRKGQFVVEGILIMFVTLSLLFAGLRLLRDGNIITNLIDSPWERIAGMIESGAWKEPSVAAANHPNKQGRALSLKP